MHKMYACIHNGVGSYSTADSVIMNAIHHQYQDSFTCYNNTHIRKITMVTSIKQLKDDVWMVVPKVHKN